MIRTAQTGDIPAMLQIYAPYILSTVYTFEYRVPSEAEFSQRFSAITAQFPWIVWEEEGRVLGYAYAAAPFSRAAYGWCAEPSIYLAPGAQRQGIGRLLYGALEALLAQQGYQVLLALVTGENTGSIAFHTRLGYTTVGVIPDCGYKHGRWLGVVWMHKRLCGPEAPGPVPTPFPELMEDTQKIRKVLDLGIRGNR